MDTILTSPSTGNITTLESTTPSTTPKVISIPSLRNEKTDDKHLFRVVDRENSWTHYYHDQLDKYFPSVNHILGIGFPKGANLLQWLKNKTAEESDKILKQAGERGSKVHEAIRQLTIGKSVQYGLDHFKNDDGTYSPLTANEWDYLLSWVAWAEAFKPQVLKHETAVFNKKFGYAGTVDFLGTIQIPPYIKLYVDGKSVSPNPGSYSVLLDWKTSGAVYDEYRLQTAAYAACMTKKPKQEFYTGVVRLGTKHKNGGFEIHLWSRKKTIEHFKQFLTSKATYHFINGNDWTPDIEEIPMLLSVSVPQIKPNGKGTGRGGQTPNKANERKRAVVPKNSKPSVVKPNVKPSS